MPSKLPAGVKVRLRALQIADWPLEQELSRQPDVVRWTYYPCDMDEAQSRQRITNSLERTEAGLVQRYVVFDGAGRGLGTCGLGMLRTDAPEIFYALLPSGRGVGAATEAARLLCECAFALGYPEVALITVDGNAASERVAHRAGFAPGRRYQDDHRGEPAVLTRWVKATPGKAAS